MLWKSWSKSTFKSIIHYFRPWCRLNCSNLSNCNIYTNNRASRHVRMQISLRIVRVFRGNFFNMRARHRRKFMVNNYVQIVIIISGLLRIRFSHSPRHYRPTNRPTNKRKNATSLTWETFSVFISSVVESAKHVFRSYYHSTQLEYDLYTCILKFYIFNYWFKYWLVCALTFLWASAANPLLVARLVAIALVVCWCEYVCIN